MTQQQEEQLQIVGIGASAGGLEALETLFTNMPSDTGMSFIIVQHLAPNTTSILPEILQRYTEMKVLQLAGKTLLEPNHVYVIPPNHDIGVIKNEIHLFDPSAPRGFRLPIDFLFRSIAEAFNSRAAGVVLSGTGSDGTLGIKAIKGSGGLTIAQDPDTTRFNGMLVSAIGTRMVDHIASVEQIPNILTHYFENYSFIETNDVLERTELIDNLQKVLILIRDETGHDFSLYKPNTIIRRTEQRMITNRIEDLDAYISYLRQTPLEINTLFHDILIGVTSFFRDVDAFASLKLNVLPALFERKTPHDPIRVWVPGCSTGEEAISIAILLEEYIREHERPQMDIQVFATDIDDRAIAKARDGIFPPNIALDVPAEFLQRYFIQEDDHTYRLQKRIRRHLIFAEQNIIKDPPFSNIDLVSCRNMLIYLSTELQKTVLNVIHYALNNDGFLFLGGSESVSAAKDLFTHIDQRHRIFRKLNVSTHFRPLTKDHTPNAFQKIKTKTDEKKQVQTAIESKLLEVYAPPSVIVQEEGDILYHQGDTSKFWTTITGASSLNILYIARPELRGPLRIGINKALVENRKQIFKDIEIQLKQDSTIRLDLVLRPTVLPGESQKFVVVSFEEKPLPADGEQLPPIVEFQESAVKRIQELEDEVKLKDEYLRSTIQQLDAANEELQSVNEEFQSSNEELRSTNEELETSREELQAINEELLTMNAELNSKLDELNSLNNDQRNILRNINIGILILTDNMHVRLFNPIAASVFNLIESDNNRLITQLAPNFSYDNLVTDIQKVVRTLRPKSVELAVGEDTYLLQIHPYRTPERDIEGSVLTFTLISEQKLAEEQLRQNQQKLQSIIDLLPVGVSLLDRNRKIIEVNHALEEILDLNYEDLKAGKYASRQYIDRTGRPLEPYEFASNRAIAEQRPFYDQEIGVVKENGQVVWTKVSAAPLDLPGLSAVIVTADITESVHSEQQIEVTTKRFKDVLINSKTMVFEQDTDLRFTAVFNPHPDFAIDNLIGRTDTDLFPAENATYIMAQKRQVLASGEPVRLDFQTTIGRQQFYYDTIILPKYDRDGQTMIGILISATDITERKQAEQALKENEERFFSIFHTSAIPLALVRLSSTQFIDVNQQMVDITGYTHDELIGRSSQELALITQRPQKREELIARIEQEDGFNFEEFVLTTKSGEERVVIAATAKISRQEEDHAALIVFDITKRKQIERQYELQSEIVANMAEGVYVIQTANGEIAFANPRFEKIFGYDRHELIGQHVSIVNAPDTAPPEETAAQIMQALRENGQWSGQVHNIRKDGTTFWSHANVSTFNHPDYGEVWISVHQDITSQKQHEQALKYAEARYKALQKLYPATSVMLFDQNLTFTHIIGYDLLERLGFAPQEMLHKTIFEIFSEQEIGRLEPLYQAALNGQESRSETAVVTHDQPDIIYEELCLPLFDPDNLENVIVGMAIRRQIKAKANGAEKTS